MTASTVAQRPVNRVPIWSMSLVGEFFGADEHEFAYLTAGIGVVSLFAHTGAGV